jgi:sialic acid synthase SpsE
MSKQLVAARDLPSGHVLAKDDVAARSPGGGLTPDRIGEVLGGTLAVPLAMDEAISLDALS